MLRGGTVEDGVQMSRCTSLSAALICLDAGVQSHCVRGGQSWEKSMV